MKKLIAYLALSLTVAARSLNGGIGDSPEVVIEQTGGAHVLLGTYQGHPSWYTNLSKGNPDKMLVVFDQDLTKAILYIIPMPRALTNKDVLDVQRTYEGEWRIVSADGEYTIWINYQEMVVMVMGVKKPSLLMCDREGFNLLVQSGQLQKL